MREQPEIRSRKNSDFAGGENCCFVGQRASCVSGSWLGCWRGARRGKTADHWRTLLLVMIESVIVQIVSFFPGIALFSADFTGI